MARKTKIATRPGLSDVALQVSQEHRDSALHLDRDKEQEIIYIPIADVYPSPSNPRRHIDQRAIEELCASIKKFGVIQPVTVRLKKGMAGKYELICGERRWQASKLAARQTLPAIVRDLSDDEVLDLQFAENLERQDVHPMDEAITFRAMLDTHRYTIADIAHRIVKGEAFVAQRLSLNSLIKEFQDDFWSGKFLVGHAILFSRLPEKDQKELHKQYAGRNNYETLSETKDFIDRNVIRKLSSAPFKRDDADLVPAAGPCNTCLKRSGCNASLFADYKDDDRCFDAACFQQKQDAFVINKVKTTLDTKPEVLLVHGGHYGDKVAPAVKKLASDMKVDIIEAGFHTISSHQMSGSTPVKVLMVSGMEAGKMKTMYTKSKTVKAAAGVTKDGIKPKRTLETIQDEIDGLKKRQERALELDSEKVWGKVNDLLDKPGNFPLEEELVSPAFSDDERNAMAIALIEKMDDPEYEDRAFEILKFKGVSSLFEIEVKDLSKLKVTYEQLRALQRLFMIAVMREGLGYKMEMRPFLLMKVLKETPSFKKPVDDLESVQAAEAGKRIAGADKRMKALKEEKKELEGKEPKKSAKAAKAKGTGKKLLDMSDDELTEMELEESEGIQSGIDDDSPGGGFDSIAEIEGFEDGGI